MAASNPYQYMALEDEEKDPWRDYEPWEVDAPEMPDFTNLAPSTPPTWNMGPDYEIPGNIGADGTPIQYPAPWMPNPRPGGSAGMSPFWNLGLPTIRTNAVTNPQLAGRTAMTRTGVTGSTGLPPATAVGTTGTTGTTAEGTAQTTVTPQEWAYWNQPDDQLKGLQTWAAVMLPYVQAQQNAYQWGSEYDEANRRWNTETPWRMKLERYNMDLATRQQQMAERQTVDASQQWRQEFARQAQNDEFAQDLANRELALAEERMGRELTIAERDQVWRETYQAAQLEIERERIEAEREAARYAAFGRSRGPAQFVANWG